MNNAVFAIQHINPLLPCPQILYTSRQVSHPTELSGKYKRTIMASNASTIPSEIFYHIAKKNLSIDELIRQIYISPSSASIDHFKSINSHLKDGKVKVGQMVVITPPNSLQCTSFESDLAEAAVLVDQKLAELSLQEREAKNNGVKS